MSMIIKKSSMGAPIKKSSRLVHAPSKAKAITAFVILVLGVALMPSGFLLADLIQSEIDAGVADQVAVPHPHDGDFDEWVNNDYEDAVPLYKTFYMWNMQNPEGILAGEKPEYSQVGPFNFRIYNYKYDIDFSRNKEEVEYKSYTRYVEIPGPYSLDTNITNINPGYLGVLDDKGSEAEIVKSFFTSVLVQVQEIFAEELEAVMADFLTEEGIRELLEGELEVLINDLLADLPDWILDIATGAIQVILNGLNGAIELFQGLVEAAQTAIGWYQSLIQAAQDAINWFQGLIADAQGLLIDLRNELAKVPSWLRWTVQWLIDLIDATVGEIDEWQQDIDNFQDDIASHQTDVASLQADIAGFIADIDELQLEINGIISFLDNFELNIAAYLAPILVDLLFAIIPPDVIVELLADGMPSCDEIFFEEWANDYFPEVDLDLSILSEHYQGLLDNWDWGMLNVLGPLKDVVIDLLKDLVDWVILDCPLIAELESLLEGFIQDLGAGMVDDEGSATGEGVDIDGRYPYNYEGSYSDLAMVDRATEGGTGITQAQCELLWDNESANSLTGMDADVNPIWFEALDGDEESRTALMVEFGLTEDQLDYILRWIDVSINGWLKNMSEWTILNDFESGLIVTRTVDEWLFSAVDKLILESNPDRANVNIFDDCHNTAEAEAAGVASYTVKTGRGDISEVGEIVEYNGEDKIYLWAKPIDVAGTSGLQHSPGVEKDDTLDVFNDDLRRTMEFEYSKEKELYDIQLLRFNLKEDTFEADPFYSMDRKGLANMACVHGVDISISKPHFLDGDPTLVTSIGGLMPSGDHDTFIDVEPITGLTMRAQKRYQVNLGVVPTDLWFTDILQNDMPIVWVEEGGEITEELAEEFKDLVYGAMELKETVPLVCLGIGAALCIPGVLVNTTQSVKRENYTAVMAKRKKLGTQKKAKLLGTINAPELENVLTELKGDGITSLKFSTVPTSESAKD